MKAEEMMLWRSSSSRRKVLSCNSNSHHVRSSSSSSHANMLDLDLLPTNYNRSKYASPEHILMIGDSSAVASSTSPLSWRRLSKTRSAISSLVRSLQLISIPIPTCSWLGGGLRKVTGTLFGRRKGHVTFAVQDHPRSHPLILIQLPSSTSALVKEMSSGLLRIALECHKSSSTRAALLRLYNEPLWTMYCNGRKCTGYATSRACSDSDLHVLTTIQSVSAGAGVIPQLHDLKIPANSEGELLYMRARFDRAVGTRDSEAFYMLNPDGNGGPDLSIFLLRL